MTLLGGPGALARKLDALFSASSQTTGRDQADITGLVGQYAHGNEPSHHIAYLYPFAGQPWKTQAMVRRLVNTMYAAQPEGEIGNDDCGQMSAWLVWSALGFYPVTPGSNQYVIGTPLFPKATIRLESGREFVVRADAASPEAMYITSATLNGAAYTKSYLDHAAVIAGGALTFEMSATPSTTWGAAPGDRPRSSISGPSLVAAPVVTEGARIFRGQTIVKLDHTEPGVALHYTLDGSEPTSASPKYAQPLTLTDTTTMRVLARRANGEVSRPFEATFHRIPDGRTIKLSSKYANQYSAGGDDALIDGLRGSLDFRDGRWQGYRGANLVITIDLGSIQDIRRVALTCLEDQGSWIFFPRLVAIKTSETDVFADQASGPVAEYVKPLPDPAPRIKEYAMARSGPWRARYIQIEVTRFGPLPDWHPGKGEEAWFFADEVVIER